MDAFLSRKRKRLVSPSKDQMRRLQKSTSPIADHQEESTDVKLAILASLDPKIALKDLLDLLINCDGSLQDATTVLIHGSSESVSPRKKSCSIGIQSSLPFTTSHETLPSKASRVLEPLTKKGKTVHLFTPEDIAAHTPCSIIHNFLPTHQATTLLEELLAEAPTFPRATFKLFDNVVQSPHSAGFYVNSLEEQKSQKSEYLYNGSYLSDVRELLPEMRKVSSKVKDVVNKEIATRIRHHYPGGKKLKYQSPNEWVPL